MPRTVGMSPTAVYGLIMRPLLGPSWSAAGDARDLRDPIVAEPEPLHRAAPAPLSPGTALTTSVSWDSLPEQSARPEGRHRPTRESAADAEICGRDLLVAPERVRGALEHDGSVVDNVDPVREPERHLGVLLDQQHADTLTLELSDGSHDRLNHQRRQSL